MRRESRERPVSSDPWRVSSARRSTCRSFRWPRRFCSMRVLTHKKTAKKRNRVRHGINAERVKMHVSKGDTVRVMRGDDKGKEGKILRLYPKTGRVLVEGINIVKKHRKAR